MKSCAVSVGIAQQVARRRCPAKAGGCVEAALAVFLAATLVDLSIGVFLLQPPTDDQHDMLARATGELSVVRRLKPMMLDTAVICPNTTTAKACSAEVDFMRARPDVFV